ncbi:UNVERIFIED_CONTAM: hypothetical protein KB570_01365 [Streptococcus canis]|uniref:Uncharacterized protein n=2 Tax=Streptococcus canis TaxID=1329 RepID=A0AAE4TJM4_STRCB|nr:hypothetical protein [Streptococcus canis]EIQ82728.1 hypothetical protein SCAZ3_10215 [Streptococcus canis FSL Z3-227]MDV5977464.1 hypothetical protein [Streptococcus canis]MDV5993851.1 hypothetical protein [Streptococcus canis]MDV6000815.1 hypothetical protein [Streptococcus canis]MDV6022010.1 hypothetical protein [Streptococcus canis]
MSDNRFAQIKDHCQSQLPKPVSSSDQRGIASPKAYQKKKRYTLSFYPEIREEKLEALVQYHGAKSASDYLEQLIEREWKNIKRIWRN